MWRRPFINYAAIWTREPFPQLDGFSIRRTSDHVALVLDGGAPQKDLIQEGICFSLDRKSKVGRGTFSQITIRPSSLEIVPDYLGTRVFYRFQSRDVQVVGNSVGLIYRVLAAVGVPLSVDREALLTTFLLGNLQLAQTPLAGLELVPIGVWFKMSGRGVSAVGMRPRGSVLVSDQALKVRTIEEIRENFAFAVELARGAPIFLEMTGGLDSRICLALALNLGMCEEFVLLTRGKHEHPDRFCAERMALAYDLKFGRQPFRPQQISAVEAFDKAKPFAGVKWLDDDVFRMPAPDPRRYAVITGGMGEAFRSYYAEVFRYKREKPKAFFDAPVSAKTAEEIFRLFGHRSNLVKEPRAALERFAAQLCHRRTNVGQALFEQYMGFRNRIHYGGAAAARNAVFKSFDPLYTVSGYHLAQRKGAEWQLYGELSFEIIDELFPALNTFPLAEKAIGPRFAEAAKERRFYKARGFAEPGIAGFLARATLENEHVVPPLPDSPAPNDVFRDIVVAAIEGGLGEGAFLMDRLQAIVESGDRERVRILVRAMISPVMFLILVNGRHDLLCEVDARSRGQASQV